MTNNHCINLRFNYQTKSCGTNANNPGNDLEQTVDYWGSAIIYTSRYTLVDLYQAHGSLALSEREPHWTEESYIIHHPDARPKQISWDDCKIQITYPFFSGNVVHNCNTLPGSDGSPMIGKDTGKVLAIHNASNPLDCSRNHGKIISVVAHHIGIQEGSDLYDDITNHHTIKCTGDNIKVYRVTGRTRRHYPNPEIAESWDANFRDHVITIDCTNFPNGRPMLFKEGAPITCFGNVVKVYRLENNQRRWYPTIKIANSWDSNWRTDKFHMDCSNFPEGPNMTQK